MSLIRNGTPASGPSAAYFSGRSKSGSARPLTSRFARSSASRAAASTSAAETAREDSSSRRPRASHAMYSSRVIPLATSMIAHAFRTELTAAIERALGQPDVDPLLTLARRPGFDLQANFAMKLAKQLGRPPRELADQVRAELHGHLF